MIVTVTEGTGPLSCIRLDTFFVNVAINSLIVSTSPDTNICINGTANIYATAAGGNPPISLIWNNGAIFGNGPHNVNPWPDSTFTVYAQDVNGCVSASQNITITLRDLIKINSIELTDSIICEGSTTTIIVDATGGGTGLIYSWYDGNNMIIGTTNTGVYTVTPSYDGEMFSIIVSDSCTTPLAIDSISITVDNCTGINESSNEFGLTIYPNPSDGKFTIEKPTDLNETVRIKILDVTSRLILETSIEKENQNTNIDISKYNAGIYYLQLIINDKVSIKRILKE